MKIECRPMPKFEFTLSADQVRILMWLSEHHYDGVCRSLSKVGGVVYGFNNALDETTGMTSYPVSCNWREMDTICKTMEMTMGLSQVDVIISNSMAKDFHEAMRTWNAGGGQYHWTLVP